MDNNNNKTTTIDGQKLDLSHVQNLADQLSTQTNPKPNFDIPKGCNVKPGKLLEIKESKAKKGKGLFATTHLEAGTIVLGGKPISLVMGWEDDGDDEDDEEEMDDDDDAMSVDGDNGILKGSKRNGILILKTIEAIATKPSVWYSQIQCLYPRRDDAICQEKTWVCEDATTGMEIEKAFQELSKIQELSTASNEVVEEIQQRLPLIVRYNCLSVETAPELFVHPNSQEGGHINLSGTGLYNFPSYFNHSHQPNVSRYAIGDIMFFVTNQSIPKGEELCISYIESEHLCESPTIRSSLLDMDFQESGSNGDNKNNDDDDNKNNNIIEPRYPIVDIDTQNDLMSMNPLQRLDELNELLKVATAAQNQSSDDGAGGGATAADNDDDEADMYWFKCDVYHLHVLMAITLDSLGQATKALEEWKICIEFVNQYLPPGVHALVFYDVCHIAFLPP